MYKIILFGSFLLTIFQVKAQYKNDNVLYKTVYPEDLHQALKMNPGFLLLDVRSKGENADTSATGMNIGRFKNARNIDVRQLPLKLNELQDYKNMPVFVYCSHSQRSRRASKMLADSGFTKVFNITGGMTALIQADYGLSDIYETKNQFYYLAPAAFCEAIASSNAFLLDVRSDSLYNGITRDEQDNALGRLRNAHHIPLAELQKSIDKVPKDKTIIITDAYGNESIQAARLLATNGYSDVAVLFDGINNFIGAPGVNCKTKIWEQKKKYRTLTTDEFNTLAGRDKSVTILDVRNNAEFSNRSKENFRNIGHLKNAVNIDLKELPGKVKDLTAKNKPVVVYNFTSNVDAYKAAAVLVDNGFTNVNILAGGIFNLRWKASNLKGQAGLKDWVTDIPPDNL